MNVEVPTCRIVGRIGLIAVDSPVDPDGTPELVWCSAGTVEFVPQVTHSRVIAGASSPWLAGVTKIKGIIDSEGYLSLNGDRFVDLVDLGDEAFNPRIPRENVAWKVLFSGVKATVNGEDAPVNFDTFGIHPLPGVSNDLTLMTPVSISGTEIIIQGPAGAPGASGSDPTVFLATDFGVDVDSEDNSQAFEDAIYAAAAAGGGTVLIPPGTYDIGSTIAPINVFGVTFAGAGVRGVRGEGTDGGVRIRATGNFDVLGGYWESCVIRNICFDAGNHGGRSVSIDMSKTVFEYNELMGYMSYALMLCPNTYKPGDTLSFLNRVQHNHIEVNWGMGIYATHRFTDSWIMYNNVGSRGANLFLEGGPHKIIGNHLDGGDDTGGPDYNILCDNVGNTLQIENNLLENSKAEAIKIVRPSWETGDRTVHINITGNIIRDGGKNAGFAGPAISIKGNAGADTGRLKGVVISSNSIYDKNSNWDRAITLERIQDAVIVGNDISQGFGAASLFTNCVNVVKIGNTDDVRVPFKGISETLDADTETMGVWTITDDGTDTAGWPQRLAFRFDPLSGETVETFALNEYGEVRVIPGKSNTVGHRVFEKQYNSSPARSTTVPVTEVMNDRDNRISQWGVYAGGKTKQAGDAEIGGKVIAANLPPAIITLNAGDPVPGGTAAGTIILRRP